MTMWPRPATRTRFAAVVLATIAGAAALAGCRGAHGATGAAPGELTDSNLAGGATPPTDSVTTSVAETSTTPPASTTAPDAPAPAPPADEPAPKTGTAPLSPTGDTDGFEHEVNAIADLTELYWRSVFANSGLQYTAVRDFGTYQPGVTTCAGKVQPANNAFYCPADDYVAFDRAWLEGMYDQIGDGAVWVVIPHEFGHAAQRRFGQQATGIDKELQADCFAGAFVAWAINSGAAKQEPGDADEMLADLTAVADPTDQWWLPDAHGTAIQRQQAFVRGNNGGAGAC